MTFDSILALEGRVSRRRYLAFLVAAYLVYWALLAVIGLGWVAVSSTARTEMPELAGLPQVPPAIGVSLLCIGAVVAIVLFFVCISFAVRRFHDMNLNGNWNWLIVLVAVVPFPGVPTPGFPYPPTPPTPPTSALLIWHAFLLLVPGTKGRNRYGPVPGEPDAGDIVAIFGDHAQEPSAGRTSE